MYSEACLLWLKPLVGSLPSRLKHFQEGLGPAGFLLATPLSRIYLKLHSHGQILAARIDNLPFFFKSIKKEIRAIEKELKGKMPILTAKSSSIDRGGGRGWPPIVMPSMQNTLFLLLLRPIFALKAKIPHSLAIRIGLL